jgi:tripartite-type tricarboxylate transporter receptor subunit TctC
VDAIVTTTLEILPQVQAGKVRSLALADEKRSPMLPEVPTFKESGYDITLLAFSCLIGPKGLSVEVISRLQEGCAKVCKDVNFIKQMENQGFTVLYESTEDLKKRLWKDYNLNKKLLEHMEGKK